MKTCACGCGELIQDNKRFAKYHNLSADGRALRWDGKKYQYFYRLVMSEALGRELTPDEVVHHINGDKTDNRLVNLRVYNNNSEHLSDGHNHIYGLFKCFICGKEHKGELRSKHHFCSRECWRKWHSPGRPPTHGQTIYKLLICDYCHKEYRGKGSRNKHTYCSKACYWSSMKGKSKAQLLGD